MTKLELETIQNQAEVMSVKIEINHYDVSRFGVIVGSYVYSDFYKALSALGTVFLKNK